MRHGVLIYNPAAGQSDLVRRLEAIRVTLRSEGLDLDLRPTKAPGHAAELALDASREGAEIIAVCGGDGTINEAALATAGSSVPIAILPGGTANVLARELGIPRALPAAARVLLSGVPARISVGTANDRRFIMMAGLGFDAMVLTGFNPMLKRRLGRVAYAARCAEELAWFHPPALEVETSEGSFEASMVIAANIRLYGGDFVIAPEADPTDDLLDLVIFRGRTRIDYARYFAGALTQRLSSFTDVTSIRTRKVLVRSSGLPVPGHVDGDTVLTTPVSLSVEARALTVVVPLGSRYAGSTRASS